MYRNYLSSIKTIGVPIISQKLLQGDLVGGVYTRDTAGTEDIILLPVLWSPWSNHMPERRASEYDHIPRRIATTHQLCETARGDWEYLPKFEIQIREDPFSTFELSSTNNGANTIPDVAMHSGLKFVDSHPTHQDAIGYPGAGGE